MGPRAISTRKCYRSPENKNRSNFAVAPVSISYVMNYILSGRVIPRIDIALARTLAIVSMSTSLN